MTYARQLKTVIEWVGYGTLIGVVCGTASAFFLWLLDAATSFRSEHHSIVFLLPVAGIFVGLALERYGRPIQSGNSLVIDTIHDNGPRVPLRMAPMVLLGTVVTHLFGGSAGREGTAVQMGASLADELSHRFGAQRHLRRQLLAAGVAGGFGSVFGTPIAGAIFGLEFVVLGRIEYTALAPALVASIVGDLTTRAWGIRHSIFPQAPQLELTPALGFKWILVAGIVAAVAVAFIEVVHRIKKTSESLASRLPIRLFLGGIIVVALWQLTGVDTYLGLGIPTMLQAFSDPTLPAHTFLLKFAFTVVTIGCGFLGGEVTPLFFMGAALGNTLGVLLGIPIDLAAGVTMAALFAAASNTPFALAVMAVELLGANAFPHVMVVCTLSYLLTGHRSIYSSQRIDRSKDGAVLHESKRVGDLTKEE